MNTPQTEYVTPDDVADMLRVDPRTVRNWIASGRLPALRPGRRWLIARPDLEQFLEASRTVPRSAAPVADPAPELAPVANQPISAAQVRRDKRGRK